MEVEIEKKGLLFERVVQFNNENCYYNLAFQTSGRSIAYHWVNVYRVVSISLPKGSSNFYIYKGFGSGRTKAAQIRQVKTRDKGLVFLGKRFRVMLVALLASFFKPKQIMKQKKNTIECYQTKSSFVKATKCKKGGEVRLCVCLACQSAIYSS